MNTPLASRRRTRGFTLIETLIAITVASVLGGIALPSVEAHLQRARRADALISMMQIHLAQERFRGNSTRYGSLAEIGSASVSPAGHYSLQVVGAVSDQNYDLMASAIGAQSRDRDCRYLGLHAEGPTPVYRSGPDASLANAPDLNRRCWGR